MIIIDIHHYKNIFLHSHNVFSYDEDGDIML